LVLISATAAFNLAGCTPDVLQQDTTNTVIIIESMGDELESDVCAGPFGACAARADLGTVTMRATLKSPAQVSTSFFNDVTFTTYRVTYVRTDGRNTPGEDVPFPFDGAANFTVVVGGEVTRSFVVVRGQAKLEPPLRNLAFNGGAIVLSVIAEIEFFGTDGGGRAISAKGFLNITFADFPEESGDGGGG
jgi:hypothetical protein